MRCEAHDWRDTGIVRAHVQVDDATPPVAYVKCAWCRLIGFRRGRSPVVYTWGRHDRA